MIGLLLIYFVGKKFYDLANEYGKNAWLAAILSIVVYYGGTILFGFLLGITIELIWPGMIDDNNQFAFGLLAIPFGVGSVVGLYYLLRNTWEGQRVDAQQHERVKEY